MNQGRLDEDRLARLIEAGRTLVAELDPELVFKRLLEAARELTGARYAAIGILDERREALERFVTAGIDAETHAAIGDLPRGRGVLGVLIDDPRPLRLTHVGEHPKSFGFPAAHPPMDSFLGVPVVIRGEAWGNLYLTEKDGGDFTEADEAAVVVLADWAAIAIENARHYERAESRRAELERAVVGMRATTEIARAVGGETELEKVLELIAKRGRALVEARTLAILIAEGPDLVVGAVAGERDAIGRDRIPIAGSLAGEVLETRQPQRLDDLGAARLRKTQLVDGRAALLVPLVFRSQASGVLAAYDRADGPQFRADDEDLMRAFAASAATAVHTAQSVASDRLRHSIEAAEQERRRWARELHDETLQGLAGLKVLLGSALKREDDARVRIAATDAVAQLEAEIKRLRSLITELRPAALDELGLGPAIESLVDRTRTVEGLEISLDLGEVASERLAPELESTVYRLLQEALTNAAKHAGADRIEVRLAREGATLTVGVSDDGIGFDTSAATSGFGIVGMRERAALLGGGIRIASSPGAGTTITATLPLAPAAGMAAAS